MPISLTNVSIEDCGVGVSTSSDVDLKIDNLQTKRCGIGFYIRDNITDSSLERLIERIDQLKAQNESERASFEEAIRLIRKQLSSPAPIDIFRASLTNIVQGAAGSGLYEAISTVLG